MAIANCGGLILDGTTLKVVNKIITTANGTPTAGIKANCGGVLFDSAKFKMVGNAITDINATAANVSPIIVNCGGLVVDGDYFEIADGALGLKSAGCDITSFKIGSAVGTITGTTIAVEVAHGTDVTALKPTIVVSDEATVSPKSGTAKDFTNPVTYVVTAENGTTKTYTVTVTVAPEE